MSHRPSNTIGQQFNAVFKATARDVPIGKSLFNGQIILKFRIVEANQHWFNWND